MAHFTPQQIATSAKEALENQDFDVYLDQGEDIEQVAARKESLDLTVEECYQNWPDGIEADDIFDWLEEFSTNMSYAPHLSPSMW